MTILIASCIVSNVSSNILRNAYIFSYTLSVRDAMVKMVDIVVKGFKCLRCGHEWVPRAGETPRVCPKCKSAWWDTPKKKGKE